ncbi:SDR family NAD(P)-dependent oxidoreductase [Pseudoroseicyclus aestuarii]|nr:SDR family NAD(P)-dependent oxidoreductase [Pseudoroseicyclus aestuarii]
MVDRVILMTGCSSGIGHAAAHEMRRAGWRVFASCRQEADCARLRSEGFEAPRLDYADEGSIAEALAAVLKASGGRLDALYNNGAFACPGAVEDLPTEALRAIFETNLFGWHALTRQVIPVMRAQGHGRIVNCSSVLGYVAAPWRGAYTASKYALEGLTDTLRLEMRGQPIDVVLLQPGPIGSRMRANAIPQFERWIDWRGSARARDYEGLLHRLYEGGADRWELPAEAAAQVLRRALEARRPRARYRVTLPAKAAALMRRALPDAALDRVLSGS